MVNLTIRQVKLEGWSDAVTAFIQCPYPSTDTLADEFFYYVKIRHAFVSLRSGLKANFCLSNTKPRGLLTTKNISL